MENNKDTINKLKCKNKVTIKVLKTKKQLLKAAIKEEKLAMDIQKVAMKEETQTAMNEEMQINKKSVWDDKKATNVPMQVSSELARVSHQNSS